MKNRAHFAKISPKDFLLISNQNQYNISSILLCSFSNLIYKLFLENPLIDCYEIQATKSDITPIKRFIEGDDNAFSEISNEDLDNLLLCSLELGINEITEILESQINYYEMEIDKLLLFCNLAYDSDAFLTNIVKALSYRVSTLNDKNLIEKIPKPIFLMILSFQSFSIKNDLFPQIIKETIDNLIESIKNLQSSQNLKQLSLVKK